MPWLDLHALGLAGNLAAFAVASVVVWIAGDRLARYSQVIAERTRLGQAFVSTSFLAVASSLPR
jgi:Ca2+/Na+ antiporter